MLSLLLLGLGVSLASAAEYPKVLFEYAPSFDRMFCESDGKEKIPESWRTEAVRRVPEFQRYWDRNAAELFRGLERAVGKPYPRREITATLHLCVNQPSTSYPVLIAYWLFLERPSQTRKVPRFPDVLFLDTVFHELMHKYVNTWLGTSATTPLAKKYRNEKPNTLAHLHLLAATEAVYLAIGRADILEAARKEAKLYLPDYWRAWQIVDQEGWEPFVAELKNAR